MQNPTFRKSKLYKQQHLWEPLKISKWPENFVWQKQIFISAWQQQHQQLPSLCWSTGRFQNDTRTAPFASKAFSQQNSKNIAQLLHFPAESLDMWFKATQANLISVLWTLKLNKPQETVAQFQSCCPQFEFRRELWTGLRNPGINLSSFHSRLRKRYCGGSGAFISH